MFRRRFSLAAGLDHAQTASIDASRSRLRADVIGRLARATPGGARAAQGLSRAASPDGVQLVLRLREGADPIPVSLALNHEVAQHELAGAVALADIRGREF